jgi:hypothetical protein
VLPSSGWGSYEAALLRIGERRTAEADDIEFLKAIGLVDHSDGLPVLTESGKAYFNEQFIRREHDAARSVLRQCLLFYRPAEALVQLLAGLPDVDRSVAGIVLRSHGLGDGMTDRRLGSLLTLMDHAGLIWYAKNRGKLGVLVQPAHAVAPPPSIFISPETPFGNKVWLRRVLEECDGFIYWLDKHFLPAGLEFIWEGADGRRISEVRVLSLRLPESEGRRSLRRYRDLKTELVRRSIRFEWRTIDSALIKDTHDRWIVGASSARNVPNVNAILSGQNSEMNLSHQREELRALIDRYWTDAVPIDEPAAASYEPVTRVA